ncbi:cellulase family glycosylhydrolase [Occultella kanbiaonis]|uniref:cellulase family glycosylhydrolase n=1 Tax=Occultella kanbiaonis TaxID=2675754 RepID=UPI001E4EE454|nr:cellulase family glycosylhydrolase [Occultella kanbiaonis]
MKRSIPSSITALAVGLALALGTAMPVAADPPDQNSAPTFAERTVAAMQPGWNLGNTFDAVGADETAWGNPRVTPELIAAVADQGFHSIRLPVTLGQHEGAAPDHTIEPEFLDRIAEVVDWALAEDLYVMLDLHHDSWMWTNQMAARGAEVRAQFTATWEQLAERFVDYPSELVFESLNEPQFADVTDEDAYALLHELNVIFHDVVRSSGGENSDRLLVLPTLHTNDEQPRLDALLATFDALDDENLAATVHYYGYWPFSVNIAGGTRFDEVAQQHMRDMFTRVNDSLITQGIPVIIGEYGLLGFDRHTGTIEQGEKLKFFEQFGQEARRTGATTMLWDNGQHLDRTALTWRDPELFARISTSWTTQSATASTDQVFVRPGAVTAQEVILDLDRHRFIGLYLDGEGLRRGRDYLIEGETLTLTAALLRSIVAGGELGERAELTAAFSRGLGLPWRIDVIAYETPSPADATGTTEDFAIPTQFNGDRLATMEARYADDGSNAGPNNWTPFKEFDQTFAPDAAAGEIVLRPAFFAEVEDGRAVELTFHFWSGEQVRYTVARDGTVVLGTTND